MKALFLSLILFSCQVLLAQDSLAVQKTIHEFFEVFSSRETAKLGNLVTDDLMIIEDGELWNRDSIVKFINKPAPPDFKRENSMKFLGTEIQGQTAWSTYENTARIMANQRKFLVMWIETAILVNENKQWKIKTLHSTTKVNRRQ